MNPVVVRRACIAASLTLVGIVLGPSLVILTTGVALATAAVLERAGLL